MYTGIFDTHAHYNDEQFDADRETLLEALPTLGVSAVLNCGTDIKSSESCLALSEKFSYIHAACGIHPQDCLGVSESCYSELTELLQHKNCVAIGEIGLDYHYDCASRETQQRFFEEQLRLAAQFSLPVVIYDREAHADTMQLLKKYTPHGVLHCFSGSAEMALELLKLGMYIGLGGAVTFKNARKALEVIDILPLDRLLLETDCPYMSPVPCRGKRNDSSLIKYTAEFIAGIKKIPPQQLIDIARENGNKLFSLS